MKEFPKEHKYTLGEKLKDNTLELVVGIYEANVSKDKSQTIGKLRKYNEIILLLMRIARDIRIISIKQSADCALLTDSISKQLVGWERSMNQK